MATPKLFRLLVLLGSCCTCDATLCAANNLSVSALKQMTLDELMSVDVTSVSRVSEPYSEAAAAITVVTPEHIRRSGATTIPEALRWVPGVHVARRNANSWAMGVRGFSGVNSEKLLVLSDTRSIYTPLFSGVFWDVQDYLLEDIERIEVIRGPGASLWGSNAVNGIINITTKNAADTQGLHVTTIAGMEERAIVGARYGGEIAGGHFRVFGKYSERDETFNTVESFDDWQLGHVGFRGDWAPDTQDAFTLQGDLYWGDVGLLAPSVSVLGRPGPTGVLETEVSGGNILGRWRREAGDGSEIQLRAYYDWTHRNDPSFEDDLETFDVELQHRFLVGASHQIVWGVNYRHMANRNDGKGVFQLNPAASSDQLFSAFVQDQVTLHDALRLTVGTKFEHNDFSGFELQPTIRATWDPAPFHTLWAAISRAARIPTRIERDVAIDATDPAGDPVVRLLGNEDFDSEELIAYELGYRWRPLPSLHVDVAVFENRYDGLASVELGEAFVENGRTIMPVIHRNLNDGRARGIETLIAFSPTDTWRLVASHSYLDLKIDPSGLDLNRGEFYEGATPRHQLSVSSFLTLPGGVQLDAHFRRVGDVERMPELATGEGISGYSELTVHLAWQATEQLRLVLVGQNLLHRRHIEWGAPEARGAIERGVYARVVWEI